MADPGIRTVNLPSSGSSPVRKVLVHADVDGSGQLALRQVEIEFFVQFLLGLAGLDPSSIVALTNSLATEASRAKAAENGLLVSLGDLFATAPTALGLDGGAAGRYDGAGRAVGFTVPAGQHGRNTAFGVALETAPEVAAPLAGWTLTLVAIYQQASGTPGALILGGGVNVFDASGNLAAGQGSSTTDTSQGGIVVRTWTYQMTGSERSLYAYTQVLGASPVQNAAQALQLISFTAYLSAPPYGRAVSPAAQTLAALRLIQRRQEASADLGDLLTGSTAFANPNGGAVRLRTGPEVRGLTIPAGQSGQNSNLLVSIPVEPLFWLRNPFARVRVKIGFDTSASFPIAISPFAQYTNYLGLNVVVTTQDIRSRKTNVRYLFEFDLVSAGGEYAFLFGLSLPGGTPVQAEAFFRLTDVKMDVVSVNSDTVAPSQFAAEFRSRQEVVRAERSILFARGMGCAAEARTFTVAPAGGDFASVPAANDAMTDLWAGNAARLLVKAGETSCNSPYLVDYLRIEGVDRHRSVISLNQPDNAALSAIEGNSVINAIKNVEIANVTLRGRNIRYVDHADSNNTYPDRVHSITNTNLIHDGNDGARTYQASLGASGNPGGVWLAEMGIGGGLGSGCRLIVRGSLVKAPVAAISNHNNVGYTRPSGLDIEGSDLIATNQNGYAVVLGSLGSGVADFCRLVGNKFSGDGLLNCDGWFSTDPDYQPANHQNFSVEGYGNGPMAWIVRDFGRAPRFTAANLANGTTVSVSGSAAALLFGEVYARAAAGGLAAMVWGYYDVSGVPVGRTSPANITSLGYRLGDCSGISKTLTFTVRASGNADVVVSVVFNQDMRTKSNDEVATQINAALSAQSAGTFDLWAVGERYRPRFDDEERTLLNNSAVGIRRGMVVAYDGHHKRVRPMVGGTGGDEAYLYAGVAWEDILPGAFGRVKTSGYLPITDVLRDDSAAVTFGKTFSVSPSKPGYAVLGGTTGLLPAIRSDAVAVPMLPYGRYVQ